MLSLAETTVVSHCCRVVALKLPSSSEYFSVINLEQLDMCYEQNTGY